MHFIGIVSSSSTYQPTDSTSGTPTISGMSGYTPAAGDVIIDSNGLREYVYANNEWILLGYTASNIYDSNSITPTSEDSPTWVSRVT